MKQVQYHPHLFVVCLVYLLFGASISTVVSRDPQQQQQRQQEEENEHEQTPNVDPKVKEICSVTKQPQLCETTYYVVRGNEGDKSMSTLSVLSAQVLYVQEACLVAASMASDQEKKGNEVERIAYGTCSDEFVLASAAAVEAMRLIFEGNFAAAKEKLSTVTPHCDKCDEVSKSLNPIFKDVIRELRLLVDICISLAAAGEGNSTQPPIAPKA